MLKPTCVRTCALLFAMIGCSVLTAQAQDTPAPTNKWPVSRPYLVFYDNPQTPLFSPATDTRVDNTGPNGFTTGTRYNSETALASTYKSAGLSVPSQAVALSVQLAKQEALVASLYVPSFEGRHLLAPNYGVYLSDGVRDTRFKIFADARLAGRNAAEYSDRRCIMPRDQTLSTMAINPSHIGDLDNVAKQYKFRQLIAHELLHGSQGTAGLCVQRSWVREGGPEGYVSDASWRGDLTADLVKRVAEGGENPFYGPRKYYLPLDLNDADIIKFANAGGIKGDGVLSKGAVLKGEVAQEYATGSYFEYLLAAEPSGELAHKLFYENGDDRAKLYKLVEEKLNQGVVDAKDRQDFPEHLAKFFTEYASWGVGRYKYLAVDEEGKNVVLNAKDNEDNIRNIWLEETFACDKSTDIELTKKIASARSSVLLKNVAPLSGRCFRVKWKNVAPAAKLKIQLLVRTNEEAEALNLGLAYYSGAAHNGPAKNGPPYKYCYQNVTEGGGTYGEPITNSRALAKSVDACLFRGSTIDDAEYNGKKYRALTFETKFTAGKSAGEAVFIVTNAAKNANKNAMFEVRPLVSQIRLAMKMSSGRTFSTADGAEPQVWDMVANHRDFYSGGVVKLSRDVKIDTADIKDAIASLPNFNGDAAMTILSTGDFTFNIADLKGGVAAVLMSSDTRLVSVTGATDSIDFAEECGLVNDLKVKSRSASGFELTYVADMVDLHKLVSGLMRSRKDVDCAAMRAAVVDRATIDVYLPDGRMHLHDADIARVFPEGYDDAVTMSLSPNGIADNGGLPRRKDLSTFLVGMPGALSVGGPPSLPGGPGGPGGPSGPVGDTPDTPPLETDTNANLKCAVSETAALISKLDAIANPCNCTCAALERDRTLFQNVMMNSIAVMSGPEACIDAATDAMSGAGERLNACISGACRSALSGC